MESLHQTIIWINAVLSDYVLTLLLVGCGVFFSIRTRFVQFRCLGEGIRNALGKFEGGGQQHSGISPFQSLMAAIASQVGTGNIVGASGAILIGGPGSIFWMWVIATFAMATIYAEAVLAQKTRVIMPDGTVGGGPVYYIRKAFPGRFGVFLAGFFALAIILALGCVGCMVQVNSISATCRNAFGISPWVTGAVLAVFSGMILIGGMRRLMNVTEKIAPLMAILFLLGGLAVLVLRIRYLPATFGCIFKYAFSPEALLGGGFGFAFKTALSLGIKRGLFSNEAGMGSTPHLHAVADVPTPHVQGTVAMVGLFIDTFVILTMTALVVISTVFTGDGPLAHATGSTYRAMLASSGLTPTNLVQYAISSVSSSVVGNAFVAVCLFFFCIFVRHCLVPHRRNQLHLPVGKAFGSGLFGCCRGSDFLRHAVEKRSRVGASGFAESVDGPAQRACSDRSFRMGCGFRPPEMNGSYADHSFCPAMMPVFSIASAVADYFSAIF